MANAPTKNPTIEPMIPNIRDANINNMIPRTFRTITGDLPPHWLKDEINNSLSVINIYSIGIYT